MAQTQCKAEQLEFQGVGPRRVVAAFDGGAITTEAGGLLLGEVDRRLGLLRRFSACFEDRRDPRRVEHPLQTLRTRLLKIGAQVRVSFRRVRVAMASAHPYAREFHIAWRNLRAGPSARQAA